MSRLFITAILFVLLLTGCAGNSEAPELLEPVISSRDTAFAEIKDVRQIRVIEARAAPGVEGLCFPGSGIISSYNAGIGDKVMAGDVLASLDTAALESLRDWLISEIEHQTAIHTIKNEQAGITLEGLGGASYELTKNELDYAASLRTAQIESLSERLYKCNEDINNAVLTAPFDGTVVRVTNAEGGFVNETMPALYISKDSEAFLYTDFYSSAELQSFVSYRAVIDGEYYELEHRPFTRSEYMTMHSGGSRGRFKIDCENTTDVFGRFALLEIVEAESLNVLALPAGSVMRDFEGYYVYYVSDGNQQRRPVEVGLISDAWTEIISGIEEGDEVYVIG